MLRVWVVDLRFRVWGGRVSLDEDNNGATTKPKVSDGTTRTRKAPTATTARTT